MASISISKSKPLQTMSISRESCKSQDAPSMPRVQEGISKVMWQFAAVRFRKEILFDYFTETIVTGVVSPNHSTPSCRILHAKGYSPFLAGAVKVMSHVAVSPGAT